MQKQTNHLSFAGWILAAGGGHETDVLRERERERDQEKEKGTHSSFCITHNSAQGVQEMCNKTRQPEEESRLQ